MGINFLSLKIAGLQQNTNYNMKGYSSHDLTKQYICFK